jgi:peptidoglycan/LPS O-acetylase OafA/YrhL
VRRFNTWLLSFFVTNPSSGRSLGYVDGLRALAALGVVLLHTHSEDQKSTFHLGIPFTNTAISFDAIVVSGGIGVYLFFVLSGFLLAQPWIEAHYKGEPSPALKRYFVLRITRIVPPFYLALLIVIIFFTPSLVSASMVYSKLGVFTIVAHLLFVHFLLPVSSASFRIAGQFWSLTIEMMFYLMLPVVVRAFYGRRWMIALPIGALISLVYTFFLPVITPILEPKVIALAARMGARWYDASYAGIYLHDQFPSHAFEFALGITLANLYVATRLGRTSRSRALSLLTSRPVGNAMFIAGCVITLSAIYLAYPRLPLLYVSGANPAVASSIIGVRGVHALNQYFEMVESVGFALILAGATHGGRMIRALLSFTPLRIIGIVSYTVYLLHLPLLHNVIHLYHVKTETPNSLFVKYLVTLLAQLLPISIFLYLTVERPIMRWARRRGRSASAAEAVPVSPAPAVATYGR